MKNYFVFDKDYIFRDEHWKAVFVQAPIGMAIVGVDGKFLRVNDRLCDILNYSEMELINMNFQGITHPADLNADVETLKSLVNGEIDGYQMVKRYITKLNNVVWVRLTVWPVIIDDKFQYFISHIVPLFNGEKAKMDVRGDSLQLRPTLSLMDFIADNWLPISGLSVLLIMLSIAIGVLHNSSMLQIENLEHNMDKQSEMLIEILKYEK